MSQMHRWLGIQALLSCSHVCALQPMSSSRGGARGLLPISESDSVKSHFAFKKSSVLSLLACIALNITHSFDLIRLQVSVTITFQGWEVRNIKLSSASTSCLELYSTSELNWFLSFYHQSFYQKPNTVGWEASRCGEGRWRKVKVGREGQLERKHLESLGSLLTCHLESERQNYLKSDQKQTWNFTVLPRL